jgi:hypothetical protein
MPGCASCGELVAVPSRAPVCRRLLIRRLETVAIVLFAREAEVGARRERRRH